MTSVFAHIVTFNSEKWVSACLKTLLLQDGFIVGENLLVRVTDNASSDSTCAVLAAPEFSEVSVQRNFVNLGFCAAHNQGVSLFLESHCDYLLVLNPDLELSPELLGEMVKGFSSDSSVGLVTPLLLRLQNEGEQLIDAAGMHLTPDLRHFDRGSGQVSRGQYPSPEMVFGGTGACLMLSRECVSQVSFRGKECEADLFDVYPELADGATDRVQLFDEAFFAYREDADLAWRAAHMGWRCLYMPSAIAHHARVVVPERRRALPWKLNMLGVKNRFLLQWNNLCAQVPVEVVIRGLVVRNIIVIAACLLFEWRSLPGIVQALRLRRRAKERARMVAGKSSSQEISLRSLIRIPGNIT